MTMMMLIKDKYEANYCVVEQSYCQGKKIKIIKRDGSDRFLSSESIIMNKISN